MRRRELLLGAAALALTARRAAAEVRVDRDVLYGEPGGPRLRMDI
jgi:hypothetical protein